MQSRNSRYVDSLIHDPLPTIAVVSYAFGMISVIGAAMASSPGRGMGFALFGLTFSVLGNYCAKEETRRIEEEYTQRIRHQNKTENEIAELERIYRMESPK